MARSLNDVLRAALERGVITAEQDAAIRALAEPESPALPEVARGFNWVTVTYGLGALLVVFASGWFLAERWVALGAVGVLVVAGIYAAILSLASRWLERSGFPLASAIAAMLAVSLTPVAVWAAESLSGWWPVEVWGQPYYFAWPPAEASRWMVAELATILVALLALRRRLRAILVVPIAAAMFGLTWHVPRALGMEFSQVLDRWTILTGALVLAATADAVGRRNPRSDGAGDLAFPFWLGALVALSAAILAFWPVTGVWWHGLPLLAVASIALSLLMRRRTHLVFGIAWLFLYLVYLAAEVFRATPYFPLALAVLGAVLLFATVWMQRRYPALAQRLGARQRRAGLPGSAAMPWIFAGAALVATGLHLPDAAEERIDREFRQRLEILRGHSGSRQPPRRVAPGVPAPGETPGGGPR